jgi:hypothetical protein
MGSRRIVLFTLVISSIAVAQTPPQQASGAKALFFDPNSGATVTTDSVRPPGPNSQKTAAAKPPLHPASVPANAGLMYYIELVRPSGELLRVTSKRSFHSGERVRIHFTSNVSGRLTVVQREPDGTSQVLFPDSRVNGGNDRIIANQDMVVPGEKGWFKFDNKPGQERLMVLLTAVGSEPATENRQIVNASERLSNAKTVQLAANIEQQQGSKALVLEVDEKSESPATYIVKPISTSLHDSVGGPTLAIEILLDHQA